MDAFGRMLVDHHRGDLDGRPEHVRDDGHRTDARPERYFLAPDEWPAIGRDMCERVRGRVADVGCGAGRHALALGPDHEVVATDASPGAVRVARDRGVERALVGDFVEPLADSAVDTALVVGQQVALGTSPDDLRDRLASLARVADRVVCDLADPTAGVDPDVARYQRRWVARGEHFGRRRFRVDHRGEGEWVDLCMVPPGRFRELARATDWSVTETLHDGPRYAVVLD